MTVQKVHTLLVLEQGLVVHGRLIGLLERGVPVHAVLEQVIVEAGLSVAVLDDVRRVADLVGVEAFVGILVLTVQLVLFIAHRHKVRVVARAAATRRRFLDIHRRARGFFNEKVLIFVHGEIGILRDEQAFEPFRCRGVLVLV